MESSHHQGRSGDTGEPGRRSRYSRDILTLTLEYRAWPGRLTRAHSRAPSGISNMNEIFSHFSAVNGITSRAVGTLGPISLDAMQQPSPGRHQIKWMWGIIRPKYAN